MSVVTALSLVLFVGFVATGLVGLFGWRPRMRDGTAFSLIKRRRSRNQHANIVSKDKRTASKEH